MKIGIIGAGRIGKVHIRNISLFVPGMEIKTVADPYANEETAAYAKQFGIQNVTKEAADILNDPEIEAVVIASSTDTHAKYIIEAAQAGKHIFCEKPIDYDIARVHEAINAAKTAGVKEALINSALPSWHIFSARSVSTNPPHSLCYASGLSP